MRLPAAATQAPEVVVEDASGHTVTSVAVTIALAAGSSATLSGTTTVVAGNGIAVFSNLSLTKAGSYTLVATDGSLTQAKSSAFTVTPDTSSLHLGLVQQPAATVAGQTLLPTPVVAVEDEYGNIVTTSIAKISLAWTAAPSDPTIFGSSTVSTTGGKATFANIALPKADTYTVSATASGFQSTTLFTQTVNLATSAVSSCSVASSYTYGQAATISATLTSNAPTTVPFSGTATVVDQSDNVLGSVSVAANGAIKFALTGLAAGTRTCTIQYAGDTNHTTAASAPFTLKIVAAPLTITANNQTKVYGSPNPTLTATYAGLVNGDVPASVPVIIGTVAATSGAGSYAITVSGASDPNYTVRYVSGTLTISKAPLTITANNQSKTYGNANPALAATYSGLVNGDTSASVPATLSTTATTTSKVGTYAITVSVRSNYKITCAAGTLTVQPVIPGAPVGVAATQGSFFDRVRITWTAVTGATAYDVYRGTVAGSPGQAVKLNTSDITGASYDDMTAVVTTVYYYWVEARNVSGSSGYSEFFRLCATGLTTTEVQPSASFAGAQDLGSLISGLQVNASLSASSDVDWLKFTVPTSTSLQIQVVGASSPVQAAVYANPANSGAIAYGVASGSSDTLSLTSLAAGTYYLRVWGSLAEAYTVLFTPA